MSQTAEEKSKLDILLNRVVALAVEFVKDKGGMSPSDLIAIFGPAHEPSVTYRLLKIPAKLSRCRSWETSQESSESASAKEAAFAALHKKRESLVEKVMDLIRDFVNREGGMSHFELSTVFHSGLVADALALMPLNFAFEGSQQ